MMLFISATCSLIINKGAIIRSFLFFLSLRFMYALRLLVQLFSLCLPLLTTVLLLPLFLISLVPWDFSLRVPPRPACQFQPAAAADRAEQPGGQDAGKGGSGAVRAPPGRSLPSGWGPRWTWRRGAGGRARVLYDAAGHLQQRHPAASLCFLRLRIRIMLVVIIAPVQGPCAS